MRNNKNVTYYIFGKGSIVELQNIIEKRKKDKNASVVFFIDDFFRDKKIEKNLPINKKNDILIFISTETEPKAGYINFLTACVKEKCDKNLPVAVIGMGGGTTMDIAKCVSILLTNPGKAEDYQGWDLVKKPAVYKIGIPTIAGAGAEATRTAVFTSKKAKLGINSDYSVFDQIILDPNFLETVPNDKLIYTAMDCYLHDIELLKGDNSEITKSLADKSLQLMREVFLKKMNYEKLMIASYLGGCAMATALGGHICHPVSYGLSFVLGYRHGMAVCIAFNALEEYYPDFIEEFRGILKKFKVKLPKNIMKNVTEEQLNQMAESTLKNEKPLMSAFGKNWQKIFTKEKVKKILLKM